MLIRKIEINDYYSIAEIIRNDLGYKESNDNNVQIRLNKIKKKNNYKTIVAEINKMVVGFVGIERILGYEFDGEYIRLCALAVKKEYRNKGIGKSLIKYIEEYAKHKKINGIVLSSRKQRNESHIFYEKMGYIKKGYSFIKRL